MGTKTQRSDCLNNDTISTYYAGTLAPRLGRNLNIIYKTQLDKAIMRYYCLVGGVKEIARSYELSKLGVLHVHLCFEALKGLKYSTLRQDYYSTKTLRLDTAKDKKAWLGYITKDKGYESLDSILIRHYSMHNNMFQEKNKRRAFDVYDGNEIIIV